jgi:hypothetical protein
VSVRLEDSQLTQRGRWVRSGTEVGRSIRESMTFDARDRRLPGRGCDLLQEGRIRGEVAGVALCWIKQAVSGERRK